MKHTVALLNDSFPPQIDGVANAISNYALHISRGLGNPLVLTPEYPENHDSEYPYPILRYPSLDARKRLGYMVGLPFSPKLAERLVSEKTEIIHCHCPMASLILARELRELVNSPLVFTYHTKFDVDIQKALHGRLVQNSAIRFMVDNISACDEVWAVSDGAGKNLCALGYEGDYIVMENGVDVPKGRKSDEEVLRATAGYDLPEGVPVFLFVGRMRWYKNQKISFDAMAILKQHGHDFRFVLIGDGDELQEMKDYADSLNIGDKCIFTGAIHDREEIRCWYTRADLFLFPSTYDTNGLVVREAAASSLASILVADSCAAEGISDNGDGFLIKENGESMAAKIERLMKNPGSMRRAGERAASSIYISWEDAVKKAYDRYEAVLENFRNSRYPRKLRLTDSMLAGSGNLMELFSLVRDSILPD